MFNTRYYADRDLDDPIVEAWMRGGHRTARRLIEHADRSYHIRFRLTYSCRPWAEPYSQGEPLSGRAGYLWHATFFNMRGLCGDPRRLWEEPYLDSGRTRDTIVFVCMDDPSEIDFSFPAIDAPTDVADAIGFCFDTILETNHHRAFGMEEIDRWQGIGRNIDPRVQVVTPWSLVNEMTKPISIFTA